MSDTQVQLVTTTLKKNEEAILGEWFQEQARLVGSRIKSDEVRRQCQDFLRALTEALSSPSINMDSTKKILAEVSKSRTLKGFSPNETATFVFSLKRIVFSCLQKDLHDKPQDLTAGVWAATEILDQLGLYTMDVFQKSREEVIARQQEEMLELSTPVVKLWDGILALPMIGTLDSSRTQVVMESLLQKIMETGSEVAIIDITGVPTVDTLVAQHLIKTVTAARLMGAECIISGIRPQIAATIVHLGVDLGGVATKASLADAFLLALSRSGRAVGRVHRSSHLSEQRG